MNNAKRYDSMGFVDELGLYVRWADYDQLVATTAKLRELLERYMFAYPAFSMRPVGAPGSQAREEQTRLMALETAAQNALSSTTP